MTDLIMYDGSIYLTVASLPCLAKYSTIFFFKKSYRQRHQCGSKVQHRQSYANGGELPVASRVSLCALTEQLLACTLSHHNHSVSLLVHALHQERQEALLAL
jgi:hypothetical protein